MVRVDKRGLVEDYSTKQERSKAKKIIKSFSIKRERKFSNIHQGERCPKCKEIIRKLLGEDLWES